MGLKYDPASVPQRGWTPLHTASYYGNEKDVQHLLSSKANVRAKDNVSCLRILVFSVIYDSG